MSVILLYLLALPSTLAAPEPPAAWSEPPAAWHAPAEAPAPVTDAPLYFLPEASAFGGCPGGTCPAPTPAGPTYPFRRRR